MSLPFQVINTAQDLKKNIKGPETFCFGVFTEKKNYTILFYGVSHKVSYYASFQGKKSTNEYIKNPEYNFYKRHFTGLWIVIKSETAQVSCGLWLHLASNIF